MNKLFFLLMMIFVVFVDLGFAQPPPPALPLGPDQAPIDGGLALLALSGGAYALKKLRNKSN